MFWEIWDVDPLSLSLSHTCMCRMWWCWWVTLLTGSSQTSLKTSAFKFTRRRSWWWICSWRRRRGRTWPLEMIKQKKTTWNTVLSSTRDRSLTLKATATNVCACVCMCVSWHSRDYSFIGLWRILLFINYVNEIDNQPITFHHNHQVTFPLISEMNW